MLIISKDILQYNKNNINYYINIPKIYDINETDEVRIDIISELNNSIYEDILIFMEMMEKSYEDNNEKRMVINTLTEIYESFNSCDIISIAIEFSQIVDYFDISYVKSYNYDIDLKKEIKLRDLFKEDIDCIKILKSFIEEQLEVVLNEISLEEIDLHEIITNSLVIDCESVFYFTEEHLILPFSSFEMDIDIMNLVEVKIPFNKIYPHLSRYAVKKIVHKVIL